MELVSCDLCGKEVKNLGVHKRFCGKTPIEQPKVSGKIVMDEITEKPLSELLSNLKEVLKTFRHELDIRISDRGGRTSEVEIRVRIQI